MILYKHLYTLAFKYLDIFCYKKLNLLYYDKMFFATYFNIVMFIPRKKNHHFQVVTVNHFRMPITITAGVSVHTFTCQFK